MVVVVKFVVALDTNALAVFGDALQSSVDAVNNLFGLAVVRLASKAPDEDHPYGHAKFETLGALLIALLLSLSIFELVRGAIARLFIGAPPLNISSGNLALLVFTLAVNVAVVWFETRAGRRLQSDLLLADALHTRTDVFITLGVLTGLALARAGWPGPIRRSPSRWRCWWAGRAIRSCGARYRAWWTSGRSIRRRSSGRRKA